LDYVETSCSQPEPPSAQLRVEELYREHFSMVWRGLRRLGVPEASVEDAVQDVFLVVHRRLLDFEGRSAIQTWLYGIALRVAKDYRRSQGRHAQKMAQAAQFLSPALASSSSPVDDAERREASRLLHAILAELHDEHREVLVLVEMEGLSVCDTAAVLQIHVRACQRRLRAARVAFDERLARHLRGEGSAGP
jgi:RNA polymerase sigma-70 factor, ECF subfamily